MRHHTLKSWIYLSCFCIALASADKAQSGSNAPVLWAISDAVPSNDFSTAQILALADDGALLLHHHRPHLLMPPAQTRLLRVNASGQILWQRDVLDQGRHVPSMQVHGNAVMLFQQRRGELAGSDEARLQSLRLSDGALNWEHRVPNVDRARDERPSPLVLSDAGIVTAAVRVQGTLRLLRYGIDGQALSAVNVSIPGHTGITPWQMLLRPDGSSVIVVTDGAGLAVERHVFAVGVDAHAELKFVRPLGASFPSAVVLRAMAAGVVVAITQVSTFDLIALDEIGNETWRRTAFEALSEFSLSALAVDAHDRVTANIWVDNAPLFFGPFLATFDHLGNLLGHHLAGSNPMIFSSGPMAATPAGQKLVANPNSANTAVELTHWRAAGVRCNHWRINNAPSSQLTEPLAAAATASGEWLVATLSYAQVAPQLGSVGLWRIGTDSACNVDEMQRIGFEDAPYFLPRTK